MWHFVEPWRASLQEIAEFPTGHPAEVADDRVLATVLFTDIVESTRRATVERDEVAVAGALHHRAESLRKFCGDLVEPVQHRSPPFVARRRGALRGGDDVGEQHAAQGAM